MISCRASLTRWPALRPRFALWANGQLWKNRPARRRSPAASQRAAGLDKKGTKGHKWALVRIGWPQIQELNMLEGLEGWQLLCLAGVVWIGIAIVRELIDSLERAQERLQGPWWPGSI